MTTIAINKNIPLSEKLVGAHAKYPFENMEKGDSFDLGEYDRKKAQSIYGCIYHFIGKKENSKKKFTCRKTKDNRIFVWRTK